MTDRIIVLDGHALNPGDLDWSPFAGLGSLELHERTPEAEVVARAGGAGCVLLNKTPMSRATLARLPALRYIGVLATGYDVVDVAAARERGIVVSNVPTYASESVAQYTFALLLALCHRVEAHSRAVQEGRWCRSPDFSFWDHPQFELAGKTMGIVGFGRIGRAVGRIAASFGMRVVSYSVDRGPIGPIESFAWVGLDDLLRSADVVSLHCPLTPESRGMINRQTLARMKPTALLLNTARGALVVESDLAEALNAGRIAGAAVDVLSTEPPVETNPLLSAKNCLITPHVAWASREARTRLMATAVANVEAFLAGQPQNVVR